MPISQRHHPETDRRRKTLAAPSGRRHYHGENLSLAVIQFLNSVPNGSEKRKVEAAQKRIRSLLEMLRQLKFGKACYYYGDDRLHPLFPINRLLERYKTFSWVVPTPIYALPDSPWERVAAAQQKKPLTLNIVDGIPESIGTAAKECGAVRALIRLAELNCLGSLKTCGQCGGWFFAKFTHQEFCRKECRIKRNSLSEDWKEYKRNKAREYYQLHKSGSVRER